MKISSKIPQGISRFKKVAKKSGTNLLHLIRERYQRLPSLEYLLKNPSSDTKPYVEQLREDGIVKLEEVVSGENLSRFCAEFEDFVNKIEDTRGKIEIDQWGFTEEYFSEDAQSYMTNNPFKHSDELVQLCAHEKLVEIINHYLRRNAFIHQAVGSRHLPLDKTNFSSFQWHHDAWGKRINLMVLLSEVGEGDQYMTYAKGSHLIRHTYERYQNSRITEGISYAESRLGREIAIFKATGKPGDVFLFDPNGLHSGNRTTGRPRDTFIVNYTVDKSYIYGLDFKDNSLINLSREQFAPFSHLVERTKSQDLTFFPKYRSWIDSLPHPSAWL